MIVVFVDGPGEGVFDRDHRARRPAVLDAAKNILEPGAGKHFDIGSEKPPGRLLAKSAAFPLKSNRFRRFHRSGPSQRRASWAGRPMRSRTRSTVLSTISSTVW